MIRRLRGNPSEYFIRCLPIPQLDPKSTTVPGLGFDTYSAAHSFGNLAHNGQADASAFVLVVQFREHAEQALLGGAGNSNPIVLNAYANEIARGFSPDANRRPDPCWNK